MKFMSIIIVITSLLLSINVHSNETEALNRPIKLNEIQVYGSHNSYKKAIDPHVMTLIKKHDLKGAMSLEYSHQSLAQQLSVGLRNLELDVLYDPNGGLYLQPKVYEILPDSVDVSDLLEFDKTDMHKPGFKVLHIPDIDFRSSCTTFIICLKLLKKWSNNNQQHTPVFVTLNLKEGKINSPWQPTALKFDTTAMDELDKELLHTLGKNKLVTPDQVKGKFANLNDAVIAGNWPSLEQSKGKFIFIIDENKPHIINNYSHDQFANLSGRAMFINAPVGTPMSAILIINNPVKDGAKITDLVQQGYIVRTRADAGTWEARSGDTRRRDMAFNSGAQIITTDYYMPSNPFKTYYRVTLPEGGNIRCNPILRPSCQL